jgi:hypothetical protein
MGSKDKNKDSLWSYFKKKEYQTPSSMNVTWVHDILTKPGKPPTRGFGGRFYFYNERSQAIPVDGELTVYGFDDTHKSHDAMNFEGADKRFKFTPEQFTTHFSESELGASYSIWIPWDAAPGFQKKIMLIPTFMSKDGRVIRGNAAVLNLPGPPSNPSGSGSNRVIQASSTGGNLPNAVVSANHLGVHDGTMAQQKTTTIQLPARAIRGQPRLTSEQANEILDQLNQQTATHDPALEFVTQAEQLQHPVGGGKVETPTPTSSSNLGIPAFQSIFQPPAAMPLAPELEESKPVNGWIQPGFARASWSGLTPRSGSTPHQAPTSSIAPSTAYPPR